MPRLQIIGAADSVSLPNATPEAFGAGVGRAMQETGRVGQALGQVLQQVAESKAKSSAAAYERDLGAAADQILLDPDIESRGKKFESVQRKLQEQYRPKLGARGAYDAAAGSATIELRTRFDHKTMLDGIDEARRNTEITIGHKALKAATSDTDEEVGTLFQEIQNDLAQGSLYLTPAQQTQMLQGAIGQGLRAMTDTNPKRALEWIGRAGTLLPPEVIAVYREEALTNIRQSAALERARADDEYKTRIRAEKESSAAAEERLMDLEQSGDLTLDAVRAEKDLSPTAYGRWKRLATGDKSGGGSKPEVYISLSDAAAAGEDVVEDANTALTNGDISRSERDSIVKTSRDERFMEPRKSVLGALKALEQKFPTKYSGVTAKGLAEFDAWVAENRGASRTQSDAKAMEIIGAGRGYKAQTTNAPAKGGADNGRPLDSPDAIKAEIARVNDMFNKRLIDSAERNRRFMALREAQSELDAEQEAAKAQ